MKAVKHEFDSPWKKILDLYFKDFIAYCWPEKFADINWKHGYKMLDKELLKIARHAPVGNRIVDKLVEIKLLDGKAAYVLLHLEIQGAKDLSLEERMFVYRFRAWELHRKPIASLAILIDSNANWNPSQYRQELWGSYMEMGFPSIKLINYKTRLSELENSTNPFAHVILAQLAAIEKEKIETKLQTKIRLTKGLYKFGWTKDQIMDLFCFIDWVVALPAELELEYYETIEQFETEELKVAYITSAERIGMERGLQRGVQQGESTLLMSLLTHKFNSIPEVYCSKIRQADPETLLNWGKRVLDKATLEEIFED